MTASNRAAMVARIARAVRIQLRNSIFGAITAIENNLRTCVTAFAFRLSSLSLSFEARIQHYQRFLKKKGIFAALRRFPVNKIAAPWFSDLTTSRIKRTKASATLCC